MEDAVHPFEGTVQGFFISDISLKQRRKARGQEVCVQGKWRCQLCILPSPIAGPPTPHRPSICRARRACGAGLL